MFDPIATRIELAFRALHAATPAEDPELDALFARLRADANSRQRADAARRIWKRWDTHREADANAAMRSAVENMDFGDFDSAKETLDDLVERWPGWAEAWNKRATLRFLNDEDAASLDDIARVLEREPRHFGALSGLGQICLRSGHSAAALHAFERVLALDPGLGDVQLAVEALRLEVPHVVN